MLLSLQKAAPEATLAQLMAVVLGLRAFRDQSSPLVQRDTVAIDGNAAAKKALAGIAGMLRANERFSAAVRPAVMTLPALYRYRVGDAESPHVATELVGWAPRLRADVVVILGLSEGSERRGGDVRVQYGRFDELWQPMLGACIAFPASARQSVTTVTRGEQWLAVWRVQSVASEP